MNSHDIQARCAEVVAALGREWNLTPDQEAAYVQALRQYLPDHCTNEQLQRLAMCYHLDHYEVQALRDPQHPGHRDAWRRWRDQAARILRSANLSWLADNSIDLEDMTQIALEELGRSIASYRFNTRFSTWAYTVMVRAAQHALRALRAAKRTGAVVSLDTPQALPELVDQSADPEASAQVEELKRLIDMILLERGGARWVEIFHLRVHDDQSLLDIGRRIGLSTSRVSVLLEQIRVTLRNHPALQAWRDLMNEPSASQPDAHIH